MAALTYTNDGTKIFVAAEDPATGFQVVLSAAVSDLITWTAVYEPGAGDSINLQTTASNPDLLFFYGNFGTDIGVVKHAITAGTNTDISPTTIGAHQIQIFASNPTPLYDGSIELICREEVDHDVVYSDDTGATWTSWDATGAGGGSAMKAIWRGTYYPHAYIIGSGGSLYLSPNQGVSTLDITDTIACFDICDIQYSGT